jgi:N6-adenosine-specific RNA methylase IME4
VSFRVIVADPPWSFGDKLPGDKRGAERHYAVLSVDDICDFAVPPSEPDALLFMWRVSSQQEEALRVVRAWGFRPHSEIVWEKLTATGKPFFGMGRIVRGAHETCLIATKGRTPNVADKSVRSRFSAPVPTEDVPGARKRRYKHSAKPEAFYDIVEKLIPTGPYCEMFARRVRPGWTCFGNEVPA